MTPPPDPLEGLIQMALDDIYRAGLDLHESIRQGGGAKCWPSAEQLLRGRLVAIAHAARQQGIEEAAGEAGRIAARGPADSFTTTRCLTLTDSYRAAGVDIVTAIRALGGKPRE